MDEKYRAAVKGRKISSPVREATVTDRETDGMLWRAFYLGLRVMAAHEGQDASFSNLGKLAFAVREIAESEASLQDPTALAARFPGIADRFLRIGTLNIRNDRERAQRVFQGFMITTEGKD